MIPSDSTSFANACDHVERNAFDPEYVANIGSGTHPEAEPTLRINPHLLLTTGQLKEGGCDRRLTAQLNLAVLS